MNISSSTNAYLAAILAPRHAPSLTPRAIAAARGRAEPVDTVELTQSARLAAKTSATAATTVTTTTPTTPTTPTNPEPVPATDPIPIAAPVTPETTMPVADVPPVPVGPPAATVPVADVPPNGDDDGDEHHGRVTGHARVAQNMLRHVDRLMARESTRLEKLEKKAGATEAAAGTIADLKATFDKTVSDLAGAYAANPAAPPSDLLKGIREALHTLHSGVRAALTAPTPVTTPAPTPTPIDVSPTPIDENPAPIDPGTTPVPVDGTPAPGGGLPVGTPEAPVANLTIARALAAYTPVQPAGTFSLAA